MSGLIGSHPCTRLYRGSLYVAYFWSIFCKILANKIATIWTDQENVFDPKLITIDKTAFRGGIITDIWAPPKFRGGNDFYTRGGDYKVSKRCAYKALIRCAYKVLRSSIRRWKLSLIHI